MLAADFTEHEVTNPAFGSYSEGKGVGRDGFSFLFDLFF
jgi:hypothetical protein